MKRVLIVNQNWMGDVLFSTPAIRALRKHLPDAHLTCFVPPRCAEALANNPHLNQVVPVIGHGPVFWAMRKGGFDEVFLFQGSETKAFLAFMAGIPERTGYSGTFWKKRWLTRACPPSGAVHKIDHFLGLLSFAGVPAAGRTLDYTPGPNAASALQSLFREYEIPQGKPYVVVHVGGNWALKRWPAEHFAEWMRRFTREFGWKIVLCGTRADVRAVENVLSRYGGKDAVSLCGLTTLETLAELLKNAELLVSNDSGPIHLAASQRTRVLGLFGPTSPEQTGPVSSAPLRVLRLDVGCEIPCYFRSCSHRACMELLTPEIIFEETKKLLKEKAF